MKSLEKQEMLLTCDLSAESRQLEQDLRKSGYSLRTYYEGSLEPTLYYPHGILTTTLSIRRHFLDHIYRKNKQSKK